MELTVYDAVKALNTTSISYIKFTIIGNDGVAQERNFDSLTNTEMFEYFKKQCLAFYSIGSYSYIIVKE